MKKISSKAKLLTIILFIFGIFFSQSASALYQELNWPWYVMNGTSSSCSTLIGSTPEEQVLNYLLGKNLSIAQVAGIMGNMYWESSFDPTKIQGGGDSQNPDDAGGGGWGLVQWTPGHNAITEAQKYNITGLIYELSTQLDLVWQEMTNTAPNGSQNMVVGLKQITDPSQAATYFNSHFESGTDPPAPDGSGGVREYYARQFYTKYQNYTPPSGSGCSADCQSATGVAKILCAAKIYDPVSYQLGAGHSGGAAFHKSCPTVGPSCFLDCSGLVNIAVYDAFSVDLIQDTFSEASDASHWQHISFSQAQAGDLVQPNTDHVEIIDHISGNTLYTFGAHTANAPQPDQVGPVNFPNASGFVYLHYIGPGT